MSGSHCRCSADALSASFRPGARSESLEKLHQTGLRDLEEIVNSFEGADKFHPSRREIRIMVSPEAIKDDKDDLACDIREKIESNLEYPETLMFHYCYSRIACSRLILLNNN